MKRAISLLGVLLLIAVTAGCATHKALVIPPLQGETDYNRLWTTSVNVVSERFEIARAERDSGHIETGWLVGPLSETGLKVNTTPDHMSDDALKTYRRRASVTINSSDDNPLCVTVYRERLIRDHPPVQPGGKFGVRRPVERVEGVRTAWRSDGKDDALAAVITREIAKKYTGK
jgi:hypothetical protein